MAKPVYRKRDGSLSYCPVCKACDAPIQFVKTASDGLIPVNAETYTAGENLFNPVKHVSHFATCPAAEEFRKNKAAGRVLKTAASRPLTLFNF